MTRRRCSRWLVASSLALALCVCCAGCQQQADAAGHFDAMASTAERHKDDCNSMGTELQGYLADHQTELRAAVRRVGSAGDGQAKRISEAVRRLDTAVQPCRFDPNVDAFARSLAPLARAATQ